MKQCCIANFFCSKKLSSSRIRFDSDNTIQEDCSKAEKIDEERTKMSSEASVKPNELREGLKLDEISSKVGKFNSKCIRTFVRTKLKEALWARCLKGNDLEIDEAIAETVAHHIEDSLYSFCSGDVGKKYKIKFRTLFFNISDPRNLELFRDVISNRIPPDQLVKMSTWDLAFRALAEWRLHETKRQLDLLIRTETEMMNWSRKTVIITHKGEIEIEEYDYGLEGQLQWGEDFEEINEKNIEEGESFPSPLANVSDDLNSTAIGQTSSINSPSSLPILSSRPSALPRVIDFDQPSSSGLYASQLSSTKRKLSGTSDDNLPCTYLIDREAVFHQSSCNKKPAECRCTDVSWIWAELPEAVKSVRGGKWMFFPSKQIVNEIWEKVKVLLAANQLGNGAKVAKAESQTHLICLYTYDFTDIKDVFRVLIAIRRNRLSGDYLKYKTDESNEKVSMYSSPPSNTNPSGAKENVQLFLNDIEPNCKKGLVAEIKKDVAGGENPVYYYNHHYV